MQPYIDALYRAATKVETDPSDQINTLVVKHIRDEAIKLEQLQEHTMYIRTPSAVIAPDLENPIYVTPTAGTQLTSTSQVFTVVDQNPVAGRRYDLIVNGDDPFQSIVYPEDTFQEFTNLPSNGSDILVRLEYWDNDDYASHQAVETIIKAVEIVSTDNAPVAALDSEWTPSGFTREWGDTPVAADVGMTIDNYFQTGHWAGSGTNSLFYDNTGNTIQLAPDGTPAIASTLDPATAWQSFAVRGRQWGNTGLQKKHVVMQMEFYTDTVANGGIESPALRDSGYYWGFGHMVFDRPGLSASSGGSTYVDGSATMRVPLGKSSQFYSYNYIHQNEANTTGLTLGTTRIFGASDYNRWVKVALEVKLNDAGVANGEIRLYVDGVLEREDLNLEIREYDDQWLNGFGMFHAAAHQLPSQSETLFYRNQLIYGKD